MTYRVPEIPSTEEQRKWLDEHCRCPWGIPKDVEADTVVRKVRNLACENHKPEEARYGDLP